MRPRTVLVVDDAPCVVEVITEILKELGYEVDGTTDGRAALRLFSANRHDVVLTDLRMPGLSGWELIAQVRRLAPMVPIIVMSGAISDDDRSTARTLDVRLLEKPLLFDELEVTIAACVEPLRAA